MQLSKWGQIFPKKVYVFKSNKTFCNRKRNCNLIDRLQSFCSMIEDH